MKKHCEDVAEAKEAAATNTGEDSDLTEYSSGIFSTPTKKLPRPTQLKQKDLMKVPFTIARKNNPAHVSTQRVLTYPL